MTFFTREKLSGNVCGICGEALKLEEDASHGIVFCASIPQHEVPAHEECMKQYVRKEAELVLQTQKLQALLPRLGGGGASTKFTSKSLQKSLGIVKTETQIDLAVLTAKSQKSYLAWAASDDFAQTLLVVPCPMPNCGITLERWVGAQRSEKSRIVFQASSNLGGDDGRSKNEDERCSGITSSGQKCQRCITEDGGDVERALCRKCVAAENERIETAARLVEKIERQRSNERKKNSGSGVGGNSNRSSDALNGKRRGTPQNTRNGPPRLGDMQAILAATAKPTARCSSCDVEYFCDTVKKHCSSRQIEYSSLLPDLCVPCLTIFDTERKRMLQADAQAAAALAARATLKGQQLAHESNLMEELQSVGAVEARLRKRVVELLARHSGGSRRGLVGSLVKPSYADAHGGRPLKVPHRFGRMKKFLESFDGVVQVNTSHRQKGSSGDEPMFALASPEILLRYRNACAKLASQQPGAFNFDDDVYDDEEEGEIGGGYSRHGKQSKMGYGAVGRSREGVGGERRREGAGAHSVSWICSGCNYHNSSTMMKYFSTEPTSSCGPPKCLLCGNAKEATRTTTTSSSSSSGSSSSSSSSATSSGDKISTVGPPEKHSSSSMSYSPAPEASPVPQDYLPQQSRLGAVRSTDSSSEAAPLNAVSAGIPVTWQQQASSSIPAFQTAEDEEWQLAEAMRLSKLEAVREAAQDEERLFALRQKQQEPKQEERKERVHQGKDAPISALMKHSAFSFLSDDIMGSTVPCKQTGTLPVSTQIPKNLDNQTEPPKKHANLLTELLTRNGLQAYAAVFEREQVDMGTFVLFEGPDLEEIGITDPTAKFALLRLIEVAGLEA